MENKKLTAKQEAFCREYIANGFNGFQAAVKAGYAEDSARVEASRLLTNANVAAFIDELKKPITKKTTMNAEKLAQMVAECLEFDLTEWFDLGPNGQLLLRCALSELPESIKKTMIQGFKQTKFGVEVNLVSKQFLLDMQARFLSMYKDQLTIKEDGNLTPEEQEELDAYRLKQDGNKPPTA